MTERNDHLSFSRLARYERCPRSYQFQYVDKFEPDPVVALRFGKVIHAALERLLREVLDDEHSGLLDADRALVLFREAWAAEGLTGIALFQEGFEILKRFVRDQGVVDHWSVLAVEKEFQLTVGPFTVVGFIDRVDRIDDETIEIIDYKTNHQLYTRDEIDGSLQMSLYRAAARKLWPWARKIRLTFWMLRHGIRQVTERTDEQIESALAYVETLGRQTETATDFPARLNTNCPFCDHRARCDSYADALKGKRELICDNTDDLAKVAREREEVARLTKILGARKDELEKILKAHLRDASELILGGVRYTMFNVAKVVYPLDHTLAVISTATGQSRAQLVERIAGVDKEALDALLKELQGDLGRPRVELVKAELDAAAHKSYSPRFWAKEVKA